MFSVGNKELESRYRKIKYNTFSKNELRQEHLKLQKKLAEYQGNKYNDKEVENSDGSVSELNNDDEDVDPPCLPPLLPPDTNVLKKKKLKTLQTFK